MFLASHTALHLQEFFRCFTGDATLRLPVVRVHSNALARFVTRRLRIAGITIGRRILIAPSVVERNMKGEFVVSEELLVHEMMHVLQFKREGFVGFLARYVSDYLKILWREKRCDGATRMRAYLAIPAECEARAAAREYMGWRVTTDEKDDSRHDSPICLCESRAKLSS